MPPTQGKHFRVVHIVPNGQFVPDFEGIGTLGVGIVNFPFFIPGSIIGNHSGVRYPASALPPSLFGLDSCYNARGVSICPEHTEVLNTVFDAKKRGISTEEGKERSQ